MDFSRLTPYPCDAKSGQLSMHVRDKPSVFIERCRELRAAGHDRNEALELLRREGARFFVCMVAVCKVDEVSIEVGKAMVHGSPAWSDGFDDRERFCADVRLELQELADGDVH